MKIISPKPNKGTIRKQETGETLENYKDGTKARLLAFTGLPELGT